MPHDPYQIALEHHRAGRLARAEADYRAILADRPDHPDALHRLGVLLTQAGQAAEAVDLLGRAAAALTADPAVQHNHGLALLAAGRAGDAVAALTEAAALDPDRPGTAAALGRAYLVRRGPGDAAAAAGALRRARDLYAAAGPAAAASDDPHLAHDLGAALVAAGRPADAVAVLGPAGRASPDDPAVQFQLAAAHRALGDAKAARAALNRALEADRSHAAAWHALGVLEAEAANLAIAEGMFRRAIKAKPDYAAAYAGLADVIARGGDGRRDPEVAVNLALSAAAASVPPAGRPASVAAYERQITPAGDAARLHEALSALVPVMPPPQASAAGVTELFDRYAPRFDAHLTGELNYRAPALIAAAVRAALAAPPAPVPPAPPAARGVASQRRRRAAAAPAALAPSHAPPTPPLPAPGSLDVLDLGCGTGLCGPLLRPLARTLAGVDLSPAMVEQAKARGTYDHLEAADLLDALGRTPPASLDLVVAADVFVYVGDLTPAFERVVPALRPGGLLAFTVEAGPGDRFTFAPATRRYAHAERYVRHLARIFGLAVVALDVVEPRTQAGRPVPGLLAVLRRP